MSLCVLLLSEAVLFVGGTVHSMTPGEAPRLADVLVEEGRIVRVEPGIVGEAGVRRVDCTGKHLLPGLIDAYVSFDAHHDAYYTAAGITTVRDLGGEQTRLLTERLPEARDRTPGPFLVTAGALLDGEPPATPTAGIVRNADQAATLVPLLAQNGADFISIHQRLNEEAYAAILDLAHGNELSVWGPRPLGVTFDRSRELGQDGYVGLDALLDAGTAWHVTEDVTAHEANLVRQAGRAGKAGVAVVPMLRASAVRTQAPSEQQRRALDSLDQDYERWWNADWEARRGLVENDEVRAYLEQTAERQRRFLSELIRTGGHPLPGSASPNPWLAPGRALIEELFEWRGAFVPNQRILECVTFRAAAALGQGGQRGELAPDRVADIVVVDADPLVQLETLMKPQVVCVRGQVLDRVLLDDLVTTAQREAAERKTAQSRALEVAPLELPEGHPILTGLVHTVALERTITAERFAVVRSFEGKLILVSRIVFAPEAGAARTMDMLQTIKENGRLESFVVRVKAGNSELVAEGMVVAGSFRVRRRLDGMDVQVDSTRTKPRLLDVGSVTTYLALGQHLKAGQFPVMILGETLEPQVPNWNLSRDVRGVWQVGTHRGRAAFQVDEHGAPTQVDVLEGRALRTTLLKEKDAFGGAGLVPRTQVGELPPEKPAPDAGDAPEEADGPPRDGQVDEAPADEPATANTASDGDDG